MLWPDGCGTCGAVVVVPVAAHHPLQPPTAAAATASGRQQHVMVKPVDSDSLEKILKKLAELEKMVNEKTSKSESACHRDCEAHHRSRRRSLTQRRRRRKSCNHHHGMSVLESHFTCLVYVILSL